MFFRGKSADYLKKYCTIKINDLYLHSETTKHTTTMYSVFFTNKCESNEVAEFNTINEAIAYCDAETKGLEPISPETEISDNDRTYHYEVYSMDGFDPKVGLEGEPAYITGEYWAN